MKQWDVIYEYPGIYHVKQVNTNSKRSLRRFVGFLCLAIGLSGTLIPMVPRIKMEANYLARTTVEPVAELPKAVPVVFEPLTTPDGSTINPVNEEFALIVPKVGINARVLGMVDPANPFEYEEALKTSVAHASTSFFPDEDGTVYLFSHSTNYEWFVDDLNAVFYLLKNLEKDDTVVLMYNHKRYTYKITDKKVVSPTSTSYLYPHVGTRNLILQTCWPPGSVSQRLLIFADLIQEEGKTI